MIQPDDRVRLRGTDHLGTVVKVTGSDIPGALVLWDGSGWVRPASHSWHGLAALEVISR